MRKVLGDDCTPQDLRNIRKSARQTSAMLGGKEMFWFLVIISKLDVMLMSYNRGVTISCWKMANKLWLPTAGSLNWFSPTVCISADLENGFFSLKDFLSSTSITPLFTQEISNTYKHLCSLFTKK